TYSSIGNIMKKLQVVKVKGQDDAGLTYDYTYSYESNKPHAVTNINDNLTYRYDANGNMIAVYDTAKDYNRVLYWDEENRLTKTVDTTNGSSTTTQYAYDTKGMRIIKEGPYGKSIYVDTGYVESAGAGATTPTIASNHIFVGNTRVASIVKHKDETQPATYYYATDHLGSSSVLTTNNGTYYERIEYLPYGETWVEDSAQSSGYSTPYKFTGKELDKETGLYYFGARYYDARISRWISADPALQEGKYFPKPGDYDTEHDFYWYLEQDGSKKLPGLGGVFNAVNIDVYHYANKNPVRFIDQKGEDVFGTLFEVSLTGALGFRYQSGYAIDSDLNVYTFSGFNLTTGSMVSIGVNNFYSEARNANEYFNTSFITLEGGISFISGEIGVGNNQRNEVEYTRSIGIGKSPSKFKLGLGFNFCTKETSNIVTNRIKDKKEIIGVLEKLSIAAKAEGNKKALEMINKAIEKHKGT
ncbi:MAG: RHS repeat-associated core domain-containing protein, partial [Spirochaetota bacterium]